MLRLYDHIGENYSRYRRADARIAVMVNEALGGAHDFGYRLVTI